MFLFKAWRLPYVHLLEHQNAFILLHRVFRVLHIIPAKRATISLYSINQLVFVIETEFTQCGRDWNFNIYCSELVLEWFEFHPVEVHFCDFSSSFIFPQFFRCFRVNCEKCLLASSCLSFCLCACVSPGPNRRIFVKFDIGDFLQISVEKHEIWLKSGKSIGNFTWRPTHVYGNVCYVFSDQYNTKSDFISIYPSPSLQHISAGNCSHLRARLR